MKTVLSILAFASIGYSQGPLMQSISPRYNTIKQNMIESAEAMPEEHYSFKLTPAQRGFGEWIDHTVMLNYNSCAQIKGEAAPPMDHSKHSGDKPKAELQKALKESYAFCDGALRGMTDEKMLTPTGPKEVAPVNAAVGLIATSNSHYGNMVGYMRSKGIVPPSTARAQKKK